MTIKAPMAKFKRRKMNMKMVHTCTSLLQDEGLRASSIRQSKKVTKFVNRYISMEHFIMSIAAPALN